MGIPCFDIECHSWTEVVAVGFWDGSTYIEFLKTSDDTDPVWEFLSYIRDLYPGIRLFAHNAANYDNKFILNSLIKHDQKVRLEGGTSKLIWTEPQLTFEDSYLLLGRGLASVCCAFDVPRKLYWDHEETRDLWKDVLSNDGSRPLDIRLDSRLDAFRAYLRRDVISLAEALEKYCKVLLDKFGIVPSSTISLTSVKAFNKRFYPVKSIQANEEYENFIRQATFGGRNEIYKKYGEELNLYDVRRMYLSCYDVPVPVGKMMWTTNSLDEGTITNAVVKVPDVLIGPLPKRWRNRLIFPVGTYSGWWDTRELQFACNYLGVDVKVLRQLKCDEEPILEDFGNYVSELSAGANADLAKIWKLFGLRLCGKFGQHRFRTEIAHISDIEDFTGYYPIDKSEIYHERIVKLEGNRSPYIKPAINMRIRSEARIRHLKWMLRAGTVLYCDTDSVYTPTEMPVGEEPGDLHLLDTAQRAYFIKLKLYGYINKWGLLKQISSGYSDFRLCEYDFKRLLEGHEIEGSYSTMGNWRESLLGQGVKMKEKEMTPVSRLRFENRVKDGLDTLPIKLDEPIK